MKDLDQVMAGMIPRDEMASRRMWSSGGGTIEAPVELRDILEALLDIRDLLTVIAQRRGVV